MYKLRNMIVHNESNVLGLTNTNISQCGLVPLTFQSSFCSYNLVKQIKR